MVILVLDSRSRFVPREARGDEGRNRFVEGRRDNLDRDTRDPPKWEHDMSTFHQNRLPLDFYLMILYRSSAVSTRSRRPKFRNEPPLPTQAAHCSRQDIEMPMLSSNLLFQVFVTIQSNLCGFLLSCLCHSWALVELPSLSIFFRDKPFQPEVYDVRGKEPSQEIQLHTWMDATLKEIAELLKVAIPVLNDPCKLMFRIVYPDKFGRMVIRTAGFDNHMKR